MDKHLKRNKSNDNPYTLGYDDNKKTYTVQFVDNLKVAHTIEVSDKIYEAFDKFELEDISQIHKYRKHIERNEVYEETLYHRAIDFSVSVEDQVEDNMLKESLKDAINELPEIQRRRLQKYFFEDKTYEEIANEEGISAKNVWKSINIALDKIKKNLKI